jgi:hypothetical protein
MPRPDKAVVGVKLQNKIFRVRSLGGVVIDAVLDRRGTGALSDDLFEQVGQKRDLGGVILSNRNLGTRLQIDESQVIYTEDYYESTRHFDFKTFHARFRDIWGAIQSVLHLRNIRRLGFVGEYQFPVTAHASAMLLDKLAKIPSTGHPDGFTLQFEDRSLGADGRAVDPEKGAFVNAIYSFYDSRIDAEHSNPDHINANLDVQRYFAPVTSENMADELLKLFNKEYVPASKRLLENLKEWQVVTDGKEE